MFEKKFLFAATVPFCRFSLVVGLKRGSLRKKKFRKPLNIPTQRATGDQHICNEEFRNLGIATLSDFGRALASDNLKQ